MVFTNQHKERGRREGHEEGRREGIQEGRQEARRENNEAWVAWLRSKEEAEAAGRPFNELNPAEKAEQERRR